MFAATPLSETSPTDLALWLASALVFTAFFMRAIQPLRAVAILSNLAFVLYALGAWNLPILVLHLALLPLNLWRLAEHRRLLGRIRAAVDGDATVERLVPLMSRQSAPSGTVLFRKGDAAEALYVLLSGRVSLVEVGATLGPGDLLGEMSLFLDDRRRTATAFCDEDCTFGVISGVRVVEIAALDPRFGLYLTRLIATRMDANLRRLSG